MIREFKGKKPQISKEAIIDETALIMGNVFIDAHASVWPYALIRADEEKIILEERVAVLDKAFIEAPQKVVIGKGSIISHGAIVHGSKIGKNVLVGIGAIVLEVNVGSNSIIGAGAVVNRDVETSSFYAGVPAKKIRGIDEKDIQQIKKISEEILKKARYLKI